MNEIIMKYINSQQVCVLALEMLDGSPHGATVHFSNTVDPVFIFITDRVYRKSEPLLAKKSTRATVVIGLNETDGKTLQMDGVAELMNENEIKLKEVYFTKFPKKKEKFNSSESIFFTFTPTYWKFTDWHTPQGKVVTTSTP